MPDYMHLTDSYIDGQWRPTHGQALIDVVNPATEQVTARIAAADAQDVDLAVAAARRAFPAMAASTVAQRIEWLQRMEAGFQQHKEALCQAMSVEMGVPIASARTVHFPSGPDHLKETIKVLQGFAFDTLQGTTLVTREPIGVCGLITPWNFPINQVVCKIAPAIAAGCTMVLKPSEVSPLSALIIAQIVHEAGLPPGVFNLVNGDGAGAGHAIAAHPDVDQAGLRSHRPAARAAAHRKGAEDQAALAALRRRHRRR